MENAVMRSQGYAVSIEHEMCRKFECDRWGFGGAVSADLIRKHPYLSMTQALAYQYAIVNDVKRKNIDKFISDFSFYSEFSIDELLSFETNQKIVGITTIEIEKDNGVEQLEYIIKRFDELTN